MKPKQAPKYPRNHEIGGNSIRIVTPSGTDTVPKHLAIKKAKELGLDLIQISKEPSGLAICKIADFGKFKYEMEKKPKAKPHKEKEIGLRPVTDPHDLEIKTNHAKEFLESGHSVTFKLKFKGREKAHKEIGRALLDKLKEMFSLEGRTENVQSHENGMILRIHPKH